MLYFYNYAYTCNYNSSIVVGEKCIITMAIYVLRVQCYHFIILTLEIIHNHQVYHGYFQIVRKQEYLKVHLEFQMQHPTLNYK